MHRALFLLPFLAAALTLAWFASAGEPAAKPYTPRIARASDEGERAIKRIRVPKGLTVELFAAEPHLANPVAFCIDAKNRFYVVETFRLHAGVTDIRGHMDWLADDLACRTVEDRIAMLKKRRGKHFQDDAVEHDRIRLIEDTDGDGKADRSRVFADGFNGAEEGIGAGVVARGRDVWFACIPNLWLLRDSKGTGKADVRKVLHHGFGVHVGYIGHDLHGLRFGPDGKLYFSIGDRGINVKTKSGALVYPDTGCVMRCNPDGSELEVYASGLRNPQELAFDDHGNLFTGDNNSDGGDQARWVYVVAGGDSGWRIGYQFDTALGRRGPFMAEQLWKPHWPGQAAYIVPPLANVASGPSGLAYYPGLGLPERYRGHFFLCDFRGGFGGSGVRSFALAPRGASFEVVDQHEFIWSVLATDVDFGMDGAVYLTDWVNGWGMPKKGRIYRVKDAVLAKSPAVREVKKLMAEGMAGRPAAELARLLGHKDQRVRQEAQFVLVAKGGESVATFRSVARNTKAHLARLHAIWGLGQVGRMDAAALKELLPLLDDGAPEVRAQAAKVLGEARAPAASEKLVALLQDPETRVRFFAAQALARVGGKKIVVPVLAMLRENDDKDTYLRHAGVMALAGSKDAAALRAAADDPSPAVRRAVLLAWRRLGDPEVARFLKDADASLVLEAARAINDLPIEAALPQLAALTRRPELPDLLGFRVLNANFRLGKPEHAVAVAAVAGRGDVAERLRIEALRELADWAKPAGRDRVMGLWRPLTPRPASIAVDALRPALAAIFSGPNRVRQEAAQVAAKLGIKEVGPLLFATVADGKRPGAVRVEALRALEALRDARLEKALRLALADTDARLRSEGRHALAKVHPDEALPALAKALESGVTVERQGAFTTLAAMRRGSADALLGKWLDRLREGKVAPEVRLDLEEAAALRPALKEKLGRYEAARPKGDPFGRYRETLVGGDAAAGRRIFFDKAAVSCLRCHKVNGVGGEVGPDLTGVGTRQKRDYLLEAIIDPGRQIAKGFDTVELTLTNGQTRTGILKSENAREVRLMTAEGKLITVPKSKIEERRRGKSAMPEDIIKQLSRSEVRDLVEFLANLK